MRIVVALFLAVGFAGCHRAPDTLRVALTSAPLSLDPHASTEWASYAVDANIYEPLVRTDTSLRIMPALAERWLNPDDLTWVFELRPGARFHDGTPVTADDAAASLRRARQSPWGGALVGISAVESAGPYRVVVRTSRPVPSLLRSLVGLGVVPAARNDLEANPVGSGAYRYVSREAGRIRLDRAHDGPAVRHVEFQAIPETDARMRAVSEGVVDLATDVPPSAVPALRRVSGLQILEAPGLREIFLGFDVAHATSPHVQAPANPFRDRRVRQAVSLAIDRKRLVADVLLGHGDAATQLVPRSVFGFDPARPLPAPDVARARTLLAEAGYAGGFAVTLHHPSGVYVADDASAAFVAESLAAIGVRVTRLPLAKAAFFDALARREPALYLMTWNCLSNDSQEVFSFLLHSRDVEHGYGDENAGGYANPALDRIIEQADQAMDPVVRLERLRQAEQIALDDVAWVPLAVPSTIYALREPFHWAPRSDRRIAVEELTIGR